MNLLKLISDWNRNRIETKLDILFNLSQDIDAGYKTRCRARIDYDILHSKYWGKYNTSYIPLEQKRKESDKNMRLEGTL